MSRDVVFGLNCMYDLPGTDDDLDVNKIFGFGYLWDTKESARFGWNYNPTTGRIDVFAYYHVGGQRDFKKICDVVMGINHLMILTVTPFSYGFSVINDRKGDVIGSEIVPKRHKKKWSYNLGMYFGGTLPAPNDVTIEINKA